ncbi:MAG: DMT family transporter, partial [Armatimonadetes bacterium]|nr:DMT family transporter [Armatimonadota bacterium]
MRAYAFTLVAVVLWTTGPLGSKAALMAKGEGPGLTPLAVAFWAIGVGWAALLGTLIVRGRLGLLREVSARGWLVVALMGLFGWAGYPVAINIAYTKLLLPDALVISYLNPVFVTLLQGAVFGSVVRAISGWEQAPERAARPSAARVAAGLVLCLLGVAMIATEGRLGALGKIRSAEGALAALFAAVAWGVYSNLGRFVAVREEREARGLGDVQNFGAMSAGLVLMGVGLAATGGLRLPTGYSAELHFGGLGSVWVGAWALIAMMGVLNYGGGYTLWLFAMEDGARLGEGHKLPPLTYLTFVFAVLLGWVVRREGFGPGFWEGAALIAAGNVVNVWPG